MNCQEVMELMQRYIDGDLDQRETSLMMEHTEQCPDCAAMLVRLKKLSSELEQLPRVVPKFSIVDSILPELERLHAAGAAGGAGLAGDAPDPSAMEPEKTVAPVARERSNRTSRLPFRKISGVVAAGIVVGLLLFSQPDKWLLGGSRSSNDAAVSQSPAADRMQNSAALKREMASKSASDDLNLQDQSGTGSQFSITEEPVPAVGAGEAESGEMQKDGTEAAPAPAEEDMRSLGGDALSFMAESAVPAESAVSPDGKWTATLVEGTGVFRVYDNSDGSIAYTSAAKAGRIGLLQWNAESTLLYFTVRDAEGTATEWLYDAASRTESVR